MLRLLTKLGEDHQKVLPLLGNMEAAIEQLIEGKQLNQGAEPILVFLAAWQAEIVQHFEEEERALFPVLRPHGGMASWLIDQLLDEHQILHEAVAKLELAMQQPEPELGDVVMPGRTIVEHLTEHIQKEDYELIPLCEESLATREKDEVDRLAAMLGD